MSTIRGTTVPHHRIRTLMWARARKELRPENGRTVHHQTNPGSVLLGRFESNRRPHDPAPWHSPQGAPRCNGGVPTPHGFWKGGGSVFSLFSDPRTNPHQSNPPKT